tara:strand:- start:21 stop:194 length:174 start_codon:yes stop_codon:yes gene_type:complete
MKTHKLKIRIVDLREIEIEANDRREAIHKVYAMQSRDLAKLVGKKEYDSFTGWQVIE